MRDPCPGKPAGAGHSNEYSRLGARSLILEGEFHHQSADVLLATSVGPSLVLEASGQRAVEWLYAGDTVGWPRRQAAGEATLAFFETFRLGHPLAEVAGHGLAAGIRAALAEEWGRLQRRGGRLKSFQLIGSARDRAEHRTVSVLRLTFERDSLLFGVGWANDTLVYTAPGLANPFSPLVFARLADGSWASYDWTREVVRRLRPDPTHASLRANELRLETAAGDVRLVRRPVADVQLPPTHPSAADPAGRRAMATGKDDDSTRSPRRRA